MSENKRLKILFLPSRYPSKENPVTGIFIKEHAKAVSLYNEVVVIYNEGCDRNLKKLWKIISDKKEEGIRTIRIKYKKSLIPKTSYFIYLWSIWRTFRKLLRTDWKPDIIHAHIFLAGVPAVILGKIYKIPVVITEHWSSFPMQLLTVKDKIMARFGMNRAEVILPVSESLKKAIENYGIKNKFQVVPNVVNTEMFYPLSNESEKKSGIKRILMVALLTPVKGVPYLLGALHRIKKKRQDFILDIVGDGPNRSEYEKQVDDLGLRDIVKFHGLKTKPEVAEFMRQADFFVLPSLWENLPCVLIESMSSGVPVIATDVGGVNEMIDEKVGVLISPKDIEALEKAVQHLLDNYPSYSHREIAKYANNKFSYEAVGKQLDIIYRKALVK